MGGFKITFYIYIISPGLDRFLQGLIRLRLMNLSTQMKVKGILLTKYRVQALSLYTPDQCVYIAPDSVHVQLVAEHVQVD